MKLSRLAEAIHTSDEVRSLWNEEMNYLRNALLDFTKMVGEEVPWALAGGLAASLRGKPRGTNDIDVLVANDYDAGKIIRLAPETFHAEPNFLIHKTYHIRIDLLSPRILAIPEATVRKILDTATLESFWGVRVPVITREALIAMKLFSLRDLDTTDIKRAIRAAAAKGEEIDLAGFGLSSEHLQKYEELIRQAEEEMKDPRNSG